MARDGQIKLPDGGAPQTYTVPNAAEIIPKAINATFVGTGASGSFLPTVEFISDGGVVVARVPCQTTVAAGGSAEVTFAPFLRGAAAGAGSVGYWAGQFISIFGTPTVSPPWGSPGYGPEPFNNLSADLFFRTDNPSLFSLATTDRTHGDAGIVVTLTDTAYAFYAEAGCLLHPTPPADWTTVDIMHAYESLFVRLEYSGPDISIDPDSNTETNTAVQAWRAQWEGGDTALDYVWFNRTAMFVDNGEAGTGYGIALALENRDATNPSFDIVTAYLHVFAVPVDPALITTIVPAGT